MGGVRSELQGAVAWRHGTCMVGAVSKAPSVGENPYGCDEPPWGGTNYER